MSQDVLLASPFQEVAFGITDVQGMGRVARLNWGTGKTSEGHCVLEHRIGQRGVELRLCTYYDSGKPAASQETYLLRLFTDPSTLWSRGVSLIVSNFPSPFAASSALSPLFLLAGRQKQVPDALPPLPLGHNTEAPRDPQGSLLPQHIFSASHN